MKAKRGDLVLVEYRTDYGNGASEFEVERITSVTRDGEPKVTERVRRWQATEVTSVSSEAFFHTQTSRGRSYQRMRCHYRAHWLILASDVDVDATWAAVQARTDGYRYWAPAEFPTIDEARSFVAQFRTMAVAS